ncbi:MAG TPA: hypothetical protein VJV23_05925 [Candidatus Polarisedimenticolia bacterium]|nr:hypothetical protein [Candidatus Polarisedimenticolia bacterium]
MRNKPDAARWLACLAAPICLLASVPQAATAPGTVIRNVASVAFSSGGAVPPGAVPSNPADTVVSDAGGVQLVKSVLPPGPVAPGTQLAYSVLVRNTSSLGRTGVAVTDLLDPRLLDPASLSSGDLPDRAAPGRVIAVSAGYDSATRTIRWDIALLPAGAMVELSFSAAVGPGVADDALIGNMARQVSDQEPAGGLSNEAVVGVVSPALTLRKRASRDRAEVGDLVGYTLDVGNTSAALQLSQLLVKDVLPEGIVLRAGSVRLDGAVFPDPPAAAGGTLLLDLGDLPPGATRRLTYVTVATARAEGGERANRAWAEGRTPGGLSVTAGPAQAVLRVSGSLISGRSTIVGRVFVDDNRNGILDEGEPGVPWARIYLDDGTFVFTDVAGKYHLEGVRPGLRVVKVDETTLPDGLGPFASWMRSAGSGGTQFADLGSDQLFKSNVATGGWGIAVSRLLARGIYRRGESEDRVVELPPLLASAVFETGTADVAPAGKAVIEGYASLVRERSGRLVSFEVEPACYPLDAEPLMLERAQRLRAEIARAAMAGNAGDQGGPVPEAVASAEAGSPAEGQVAPASAGSPADLRDLELRVKEMTPEPDILEPPPGRVAGSERIVVEAKLPSGLIPRLSVNGREIPQDRIAVRMETSLTRLVFYRYLGVELQEGRNALVLEGIDQWGNARVWVERTVARTGRPHAISLRAEEGTLAADGKTPLTLRAEVRDAMGHPVRDGTLVTVGSESGQLLGVDAAPRQEGFQVTTRGGVAEARLSPADKAEIRIVSARAGEAMAESTLSLAPKVSPWIVAGVGEASVGRRGLGAHRTLGEALDDGAHGDGRLALYARGPLFGASLMTLAYDSARQRDRDQVFRRPAPDRFFPIYGDSSRQGYDVEGQGKFSLRLDQRRSSFAVGDFTTGLTGGDLARYDRALTGALGRVEARGLSLQSFGARTPQTAVRDEMPGAGISGPYRLSRRPLVANSERVVLETRDRLHPERVLGSLALSRFADYDIDYEGGALLFKRPVPFQDESFHPVTIVASYEVTGGEEDATVAGGRLAYNFHGAAEVGTLYVSEQRAQGAYVLRGMDASMRRSFGRGSLELGGEAVASSSDTDDAAGAVSFRAAAGLGSSVRLGASYRHVAAGFDNPSRTGPSDAGTLRWGLDAAATLPDASRLKGELYAQTDSLRAQERRVAGVEWERVFGRASARTGLRDVRQTDPATGEPGSTRLLLAGLRAKLAGTLEAQIARQQVVSGEALAEHPTRTSLGLDWQATEDLRAFLKQELDQASTGSASRTVIGLESRLLRNLTLESRYSLEDALTGERGYAQMGIRSRLPLNQDWLGDVSAERVAGVRGETAATGDFTALGVGFEYLPARVKFTSRYELRLADTEDRHVLTSAGATRITDALSLFSRQRLFLVQPEAGGARIDGDGLIGLAFRPLEHDRLNLLLKLQGVKGDGAHGAGSPSARAYTGLLEVNYEPVARLHWMGRLGIREQVDRFEGEGYASRTRMAETRILYDLTERWSAGASYRVLDEHSAGSSATGFGVEAGCRLAKDLWAVGGYNLTGFDDKGFLDADRRAGGPFFTLRFKFDEGTVAGLATEISKRDDPGGRLPAREPAP